MERFTNAAFSFEVTDTPAAGRGRPGGTVILLHGFPQDRQCWNRVASVLAGDGYRVLAPDLRGYSPGARPPARSAYRNSRLAADVLALADAAGAERFHLAGHDWGAALAWYVAGRHPGRVISLAALSVPHPRAFARALVTGGQAARSWYMAAWQLPWLPERVLGRRGGQAWRGTLLRSGLDPASADRYTARARDPAALRGPLNWYRALPFSLREPAGPIPVPVMFAWGNRDRFVSRAAAGRCGRYVTGPYRFTELDGASHWLPEQAADQVAALLIEHFAARGRRGTGRADVTIRGYDPRDAAGLADVFFRSVRQVALAAYTPEQVQAWAPEPRTAAWAHGLASDGRLTLVAADAADHPVAYIDLEPDGHIDRMFCAPGAAGQGIASRLYDAVEAAAREQGIRRLYTEASELARPVFERKGFSVTERQDLVIRGVAIHNYRMAKTLDLPAPSDLVAAASGPDSERFSGPSPPGRP